MLTSRCAQLLHINPKSAPPKNSEATKKQYIPKNSATRKNSTPPKITKEVCTLDSKKSVNSSYCPKNTYYVSTVRPKKTKHAPRNSYAPPVWQRGLIRQKHHWHFGVAKYEETQFSLQFAHGKTNIKIFQMKYQRPSVKKNSSYANLRSLIKI